MIRVERGVPLAEKTTLGLGGPARRYVRAPDPTMIVDAMRDGIDAHGPTWILGGGSNVVVADEGLDGLVVEIASRGIESYIRDGRAHVCVQAGEPWDELVAMTVAHGWAGLECLAGIPGRCGATPIQNVGAYGQEIGDALVRVRAWDRDHDRIEDLDHHACELAYRDSRFKREAGRWVVLEVELQLVVDGAPAVRYAELSRALADHPAPSLAQVREAVVQLRRRKSMVIDPDDPNHCSAGSFFTNPVVDAHLADEVAHEAHRRGLIATPDAMPRYPAPGGIKLAAAWLIEAAGMQRGYGEGPIGLSTNHALAIVHRGGGTTADLVAFAQHVRDRVHDQLGVRLVPEPVFLGLPPL
jgi:UDP-N-acetylmuramate dehydrogenase